MLPPTKTPGTPRQLHKSHLWRMHWMRLRTSDNKNQQNGVVSSPKYMVFSCVLYSNPQKDREMIGYIIWLVVWTPMKNMNVNWDDYSQYMGKYKMATKPPTSHDILLFCWELDLFIASLAAICRWFPESNLSIVPVTSQREVTTWFIQI